MSLNEALAKRIEELLKENNITQYKLALDSGVAAPMISEIRHCKNRTTALYIVYDIAQGFGMELPEFFDSPLFRNLDD